MHNINQKYIRTIVKQALLEDLRPKGDITTELLKNKNKKSVANIISKQSGVVAGIDFCKHAFLLLDKKARFKRKVKDSGILMEYRDRQFYEKPSAIKREKKNKAILRNKYKVLKEKERDNAR